MPNDLKQNSLSSLSERIQARAHIDRLNAQTQILAEFSTLQKNLKESSMRVLNSTESDILDRLTIMEKKISGRCQTMGNMFSRPYKIALIWSFGMLTMTGLIIAGMIALAQYRIQALENEIAALKKVETLQTLARGTWPILMEETVKGMFLVPLKSHTLKGDWYYNGMPAWKLE